MARLEEDNPILNSVNRSKLIRYLKLSGWREVRSPYDKADLLTKYGEGDEPLLELFIPKRPEYRDYRQRLASAISTIAVDEGLPLEKLIATIDAGERDILRFHIKEPVASGETISLEVAAKLIENYRSLMAAAASTELDPRPYFERTTKVGSDFAGKCRFGHTFHGSFGFTIESPFIGDAQQDLELGLVPPFERKVIERVTRGLLFAQNATMGDDTVDLAERFDRGFNANMFETLNAISETLGGADAEYGVTWSRKCPPSSDLVEIAPVVLTRDTYDLAELAAASLRHREAGGTQTIIGRIIALRSEADPDETEEDGAERTATIHWEPGWRAPMRVRVVLPLNEYQRACEAHRDSKGVTVTGELEKVGRSWYLIRPRNFSLVA